MEKNSRVVLHKNEKNHLFISTKSISIGGLAVRGLST